MHDVYRYLATSPQGFLQQLSVCYLKNAYFFYVMGYIREGKDPFHIDRQILERYGIAMSKWGRYRRRKAGMASLQYLRHERTYLILATDGTHKFFEAERKAFKDARKKPIHFWRHAATYRDGHAHVRIAKSEFDSCMAAFREAAMCRTARELRQELWELPFEPYAPVRQQLSDLLREVNRVRRSAGLSQLSPSCLRAKRRVCLPFAPVPVVAVSTSPTDSELEATGA